jgi:hypothetical protein
MMRVFLDRAFSPFTFVVALTCVFGVERTALAQTASARPAPATTTVFSPGDWTVTPFVGVGFSGDLDGGAGSIGASAGYVWTDRITFEGELNVLPSSEASGLIEVDTHSWSLTGNTLYHFGGKTWLPYGVFGIGVGHAGADVTNTGITGTSTLSSSSTEFVVNFGGGVDRRLTNRMGFRGDLRYFFGGDLVPNYWRLGAGLTFGLHTR